MAELDDIYSGMLQDEEEARQRQTRASVTGAVEANPDQYAKVIDLSEKTGIPTRAVEQEYDSVQQRELAKQYDEILRDAPGASSFMANQDNAKVAHDDVGLLAQTERLLMGLGQTVAGAIQNPGEAASAAGDAIAGTAQGAVDTLSDPLTYDRIGKAYDSGEATVRMAGVIREIRTQGSTPEREAALKELQEIAQYDSSDTDGLLWFVEKSAKLLGNMIPSTKESIKTGATAGTAAAGVAAALGQAGPQIATPEEIITVPVAFITAFGAGFFSRSAQQASDIEAELMWQEIREMSAEAGVELDRETAGYIAGGVGLVNGLLEVVGELGVTKPITEGMRGMFRDGIKDALKQATVRDAFLGFAKAYGTAVASETGTEIVQEINNMIAAEIYKRTQEGEFEDLTAEEFAERIIMISKDVAGGMALLGLPGASIQFAGDVRQARKAQANADVIAALGDSAKASKLRERLPAKYREFVAEVKKQGTVDSVFVDAEAMTQLFQSENIDPEVDLAKMPYLAQELAEARATGGFVAIPLEDYQTFIAPTAVHQGLAGDIKFHTDAMTVKEAEKFNAEIREIYDSELRAVENRAAQDAAVEEPANQIFQTVHEQLVAAGNTPDVANQQAALHSAFARVMQERYGIDPQEVYGGLTIRSELTPDLQEVDDVDAILAEARDPEVAPKDKSPRAKALMRELARRGMSLESEDADIRSVLQPAPAPDGGIVLNHPAYHGSPHKFDKFTLDRVNSGEGRQAFGWGLYFAEKEGVARWYWETLSKDLEAISVNGERITDADLFDANRINEIKGKVGELEIDLVAHVLEDGPDKIQQEYEEATVTHQPRMRDNHDGTYSVIYYPEPTLEQWRVVGSDMQAEEQSFDSQAEAFRFMGSDEGKGAAKFYARIVDIIESMQLERGGSLMKVELAPDENQYLNWDKRMDEQPGQVRDNLAAAAEKAGLDDLAEKIDDNNFTGHVIYREFEKALGSDQAASLALLDAGIPGIKYLDGVSRRDETGTSNYVIFDDELVQIQEFLNTPAGQQLQQSAVPQAPAVTQTPEFKAWFGDSKVVDESGQPMVVYHGTGELAESQEFDSFNRFSHFGTTTAANHRLANADGYDAGPGPAPRIFPVYLSIQNPLPVVDDGNAGDLPSLVRQALDAGGITAEQAKGIRTRLQLIETLEAAGYDGLVYENTVEDAGSTSFTAFRPEQIKSVNNRGTFDPNDPVILNQDSLVKRGKGGEAKIDRAKMNRLAAAVPGLRGILRHLLPDEKAKLKAKSAQKIVDIVNTLPSAAEMAAVAFSGRAKRGWYENSSRALVEIFGIEDAPRFTALLAALSPQTSVENNTINALNVWVDWDKAGRPTDREAILDIMAGAVQGGKGRDSILGAWINNSLTALQTEDPGSIVLSGPKVNSFMLNLLGVVQEVTNDAWMANYALVSQELFRKTGNAPGKGPGYIAMAIATRRAAAYASKVTGEIWTPAEIQETIWSWAKTLYEKRASAVEDRTALEIIEAGDLTGEEIGDTPDFEVLFVSGIYRKILEEGGYAEEIETVERAVAGRREVDGSSGRAVDPVSSEGSGIAEDAFQRHLRRAARRLDRLFEQRRAEQDVTEPAGPVAPPRLPGLPVTSRGPIAGIHDAARAYAEDAGIPFRRPAAYVKADPERGARIADAFAEMAHDPSNPDVAEAYQAMIEETLAQYQFVKKLGLKIEVIQEGQEDPYPIGPVQVLEDLANGHLWLYPTISGFGSINEIKDNPLLAPTGEKIGDHELVANDVFRIVHDVFGHGLEGVGFGPSGEENTWQAHVRLYSDKAARAMTTETRGQNSWVNFGPYGENNRANQKETTYADQKVGLLPDWVMTDGLAADQETADAEKQGRADHGSDEAPGRRDVGGDSPTVFQQSAEGGGRGGGADRQEADPGAPLTSPPAEANGRVRLTHYSEAADITELDPSYHGTGVGGEEVRRKRTYGNLWVDRTYYGIAVGRPGGYNRGNDSAALGTNEYTSSVHIDDLYDLASDPDGFWPAAVDKYPNDSGAQASWVERAIRDAGYVGYWRAHPSLGLVAAVYEKLPVERPGDTLEQNIDEPRGSIQFFPDNKTIINLGRKADLSTFLHESGHLFVRALSQIAAVNPDAKKDMDAMLRFAGVDTVEEFNQVEPQEKLARAFEAYLREGKAPSADLQSAFQRFRSWLLHIYRSLTQLDVELDDEIRGVFDRMLATDEEIRTAEQRSNFVVDPSIAALMTEAEQRAYNEAARKATDFATAELERRKIEEARREEKAWWQEERERVEAGVTEEVGAMPVYQALAMLRDKERDMKMSSAVLREEYGDDVVKKLPFLHRAKGGVHPDLVADIVGLSSGDELVQEIIAARPRADLIKERTDAVMKERHGSLEENQRQAAEAASEAIHNDERGKFMEAELRALARRGGGEPTPSSVAKQVARQLIESRKSSEAIQIGKYAAAERKAAREAQLAVAREDYTEAASAKRRQLLNHHLVIEARKAKEELDRMVRYFNKFSKVGVREKIDIDYRDQIDALLERFDFRKAVSLRALEKRKSLAAWVAEREAEGDEVVIPDHLMNDAGRRHYKEMTLTELRGVRDAVKNVEHLGRLKNRLLTDQKKRSMDEAAADIVETIEEENDLRPGESLAPTWKEKFKEKLSRINAQHTKMEFLFRRLDGFKDLGTTWSLLFRPLADAEVAEQKIMGERVLPELNRIMSAYGRIERSRWMTKRIFIRAMGDSLTKGQIMSLALNWGNEDNREALRQGHGFTDELVQAIFDEHMDKRDWDTVQQIWDLLDSFWPEIAELQKDIAGVVPEKVEAVEIETQHGTYRGGYYPLKYDTKFSHKAFARDQKQNTQELYGSNWVRPNTRHGHTKERVGSGGQRVLLDLSVMTEHLTNVVHDLTHRRAILDVDRLVSRDDVRVAIEDAAGREMYRMIRPWLQTIASDRREPAKFWEHIIGHARAGATIANMGWKITTAIVQPLGYLNSVERLGAKYSMIGLQKFFANPVAMKAKVDFVMERSVMMQNRSKAFDRDVRDIIKKMTVKGPLYEVQQSFFYLTGLMDMAVAVPTWLGAYEKGMADFEGNEAQAIDYADSVVRTTQSAGGAKDLAYVQGGSELQRMFTMFYSYFSVLYNLFAERAGQTRSVKDMPRFAASMFLLWFAPSILSELVAGRGPDPDEDEEGWARWAAQNLVNYPFQAVVLLRDLVNATSAVIDPNSPDYGYSFSPVVDAFEVVADTAKQVAQGEADKSLAKNALMAAGYWGHLPSRQMWITGEYLYDYGTGEEKDFSLRDVFFPRPK